MENLRRWILHPFLFGAYPVIALLAHNIQQTTPLTALRSLLFALILASVSLLISRLILGDWRRAALVTSLAMLIFFSYGRVFTLVEDSAILGAKIGGHHIVLPGLFAFCLFLAGWLSLKKLNMPSWTMTLNLVGLIAILLPFTQIAWYETHIAYVRSSESRPKTTASALGLKIQEGKTPPDIYYIILDMYARSDSLEINLRYDNSAFLKSLEEKGFYIATCSQSNYPTTYPSLTSSLNFNYLNSLSKDFLPPNTQEDDMYPFLQGNAVRSVLKDLGYTFVDFESGYSPDEFHDADYYLSPNNDILGRLTLGGLNPFESILLQTSAGSVLYNYSLTHPAMRPFFDYSYITFRDRMVYAMDKLPDLPSIPGPKFVFVHLIAPHDPFAFGPNGEVIPQKTPFTLNNPAQYLPDFITGYSEEVTYLNKRVLNIVGQLINKSTTPPIIILQGDHGIPRFMDWNMANLNAYYLPDGGESLLYPTISPVNSFRVIFNAYFGGHLEILDDHACNSTRENPYACAVKVDPNPQCAASAKP